MPFASYFSYMTDLSLIKISCLLAVSLFVLISGIIFLVIIKNKKVQAAVCCSSLFLPSVMTHSFFSYLKNDKSGSVFAICIMVCIACYLSIGLALAVNAEK
jgi:NADH:ubiquinone oxidoreductase subunit K